MLINCKDSFFRTIHKSIILTRGNERDLFGAIYVSRGCSRLDGERKLAHAREERSIDEGAKWLTTSDRTRRSVWSEKRVIHAAAQELSYMQHRPPVFDTPIHILYPV